MNTDDMRYLNAENKIVESFYKLLEKKKFPDIKTKEIIEAAGINKSTFYVHYSDKYDLLDKLEDRVIDGLYDITSKLSPDILQHSNLSVELRPYYYTLAQYVYSRRKELLLLFTENNYSHITLKIAMHIESMWKEKNFPIFYNGKESYYIAALAHMISGVICKWLQTDFLDSPDELAAIMQNLGDNVRNAIFS